MRTPNRTSIRPPSARWRWRALGALLCIATATTLLGCPRGIAFVPKAGPQDVRLYQPDLGEYPDPGYIHVGPVIVTRAEGTPRNDLLLALRTQAAREGADAVILQDIRRGTATAVENDGESAPVVIVEGLAIFWP